MGPPPLFHIETQPHQFVVKTRVGSVTHFSAVSAGSGLLLSSSSSWVMLWLNDNLEISHGNPCEDKAHIQGPVSYP